jgi:hypothetical protein
MELDVPTILRFRAFAERVLQPGGAAGGTWNLQHSGLPASMHFMRSVLVAKCPCCADLGLGLVRSIQHAQLYACMLCRAGLWVQRLGGLGCSRRHCLSQRIHRQGARQWEATSGS